MPLYHKSQDQAAFTSGPMGQQWGLTVIRGGENLSSELVQHLLSSMRTSAAIVAICTPDDEVKLSPEKEVRHQPRQNVLLEIGMAMGMAQGLKRLTFMRRWHDRDPAQRAHLPTDLGGVLTINFKDRPESALAKLKERFLSLGLVMET